MNYCTDDLGINPANLSGKQIVEHLDKRIQDVLRQITSSPLWAFLIRPDSEPTMVARFMQEVYLEIVMYQPDVVEATIAIIGQFPRSVDPSTISTMLHLESEEFDHGEMALKDYLALGGSQEWARKRKMSPTAFSIAAMWRFLCHKRDPFAYLGALYLLEGLTPIITSMVKTYLKEKGMKRDSLGFIDYHSTADVEHTDLVKRLIEDLADRYPESKESICYGMEYFLAVYPMASWQAAFKRATNE